MSKPFFHPRIYQTVCGCISSQHLHRHKPQSFKVELSDLELAEEDLVEVVGHKLKSQILKAKDLADEHPVLMPADIAAIVYPPDQESLGVDEFNQIARKHYGTGLVQASGRHVV